MRTGRIARATLLAVSLAIALTGSSVATIRSVDLGGSDDPASASRPSRTNRPTPVLNHRLLAESYLPYGYVAHAMGSVHGHRYTNSREAFEESYARGFRLFEVDLIELSDGGILAAHDGMEWAYGLDRPFSSLTQREAGRLRYRGPSDRPIRLRHRAMTGEDLVALLREHRDASLIVDTKGGKSRPAHLRILRELVRLAPRAILRRVIPHVIDQAHLDRLRRLHPFRNYMLALYRTQQEGRMDDVEVLDFVRRNRITAVMMWAWRRDPGVDLKENGRLHRRFRPGFARRLQETGAAVYVHSLNGPDWMEGFRERQIGVYSNGWFPA